MPACGDHESDREMLICREETRFIEGFCGSFSVTQAVSDKMLANRVPFRVPQKFGITLAGKVINI